MAKMFIKGFKPMSTSKKAKAVIHSEMKNCFNPKDYKGAKTWLDAMKIDADSGNAGLNKKVIVSNYRKGAYLVDAGCLSISDQDKMLSKIYGKKNVAGWSNNKQHEVYRHLIAREYDSLLRKRKTR